MHVVATAGHVDHGKSTLVRALTGMEPDRWAEERRRGLTIDLGFAWTALLSGAVVAFVDVPGHERFVPNMLAGVGPVPAVLFVVAADDGWRPQSAEHLAALDALGVRHGLLAVTKADLADHRAAAQRATAEIAETSLGAVEVVPVSGVTGQGMAELRAGLDRLIRRLPAPEVEAPVRLWVDRSFTVRGSGTVVTGTLRAGRLRVGGELELAGASTMVRIRALQALGREVEQVEAVARVAANLRGVPADRVRRGDALLTPGRFLDTAVLDVRVHGDPVASLPRELMVHTGSAVVPARVRPLGGQTARLTLVRTLPLCLGDRILLRDPGQHRVAGGATVLDVAPPPLAGQGAAAARAAVLATVDGMPDPAGELRRRGLARRADLERIGVPVPVPPVAGDWVADPEHWAALRHRLAAEVARYVENRPLEAAMPAEAVRRALGLPDRALVEALVEPPLVARAGRIGFGAGEGGLPERVARAVEQVRADLARDPFAAPEAARLAELALGPQEVAAAERAGLLQRVAGGVVLLPGAQEEAVRRLGNLAQPFTVSDARRALATSRRVAVPLLEALDRRGAATRLPDGRHTIVAAQS
jgi:selenocysteine-specific elongation factor